LPADPAEGDAGALCAQFSLALQSGWPVVQALRHVAQVVDNDYIGQRIEAVCATAWSGEECVLRTAVRPAFYHLVLR